MENSFYREFTVGWGDLDSNNHMRNTAYLDAAATTRFAYFAAHGFPAKRFREVGFGPVVFKDSISYAKELRLLETYRVNFRQDGMNGDGSIFRIANAFTNERGERIVEVLTHGAWFDLASRKIIVPPAELLEAMRSLPKTPTYEEIKSRKG